MSVKSTIFLNTIPHIRFKYRRLASIPNLTSTRMSSSVSPNTKPQAPGLLSIFEASPRRLTRIRFLSELFKVKGHELRIAGGAVRDILKGKEPTDIDLASDATPDETIKLLKPHEDVVRIIVTATGMKHGTVAVKFKEAELDFKRIKLTHRAVDGEDTQPMNEQKEQVKPEYDEESPYEITTLRCDKITDGRHAEVVFINDWKVDAERRDLTINAMFLTLDEGALIDYYHGEADLKAGIVRFVGEADKRVKEDYLRILRYFRFWSRYGQNNRPDDTTYTTLRENLSGLEIISGERIWQELKKIFSYLPCIKVVDLMLEIEVFKAVEMCDKIGESYDTYRKTVLENLERVQKNVQRYKDEIMSNESLLGESIEKSKRLNELLPVILISTTLDSQDSCLKACKRLKFSNLERDTLVFLINNRGKKWTLREMKALLALANQPDRHLSRAYIRAYMIHEGLFEYFTEFSSWHCPAFPAMGAHVAKEVKRLKLNMKVTKNIVDQLKQEWIISEYTKTEDSLLEDMHKIIAKTYATPADQSK